MLRLFIELPLKTTKLSDKSYWLGSINGSLVEAAVDEVRIGKNFRSYPICRGTASLLIAYVVV